MLSRRIMLGSGVRRSSVLTWESLKYQEDPSPRHQFIHLHALQCQVPVLCKCSSQGV